MQWSEEALQEIEKAPGFVRNMAKKAVEKAVKKDGRNEVSREDVMGASGDGSCLRQLKYWRRKQEPSPLAPGAQYIYTPR